MITYDRHNLFLGFFQMMLLCDGSQTYRSQVNVLQFLTFNNILIILTFCNNVEFVRKSSNEKCSLVHSLKTS